MERIFSASFFLLAALSMLLSAPFAGGMGRAYATHTDIFVASLEIEPETPIVSKHVKLTTILTNMGSFQKNVTLSLAVDGIWIKDGLNVNMPAKRSASVSFQVLLPVEPGRHQFKLCPDRDTLGEDGHQCQTLDFMAIDDPALVVAITFPKDGVTLTGEVEVHVAVLGAEVQKVDLYIRSKKLDQLVGSISQAPFTFSLDTSEYLDGEYKLYAIAHLETGIIRLSEIKEYTIENSLEEVLVLRVTPETLREAAAGIGQAVEIGSSITNQQTFIVAATLIVLVKDSKGYTQHLSWQEKTIQPGDTAWFSIPWTSEKRGPYAVEVFLWDTIENAVPLSGVMNAVVEVR